MANWPWHRLLLKKVCLASKLLALNPHRPTLLSPLSPPQDATSRVAVLIVDVLAVLVSFAPADTAAALARRALRSRLKSLQMALTTTTSPRLTRCTLKLLASAIALSPSLAREILRRLPLGGKVAERLGTTRAADALGADGQPLDASDAPSRSVFGGKGSRAHPSASAARDRRAAKNATTGGGASLARFIYAHGHADDDVRSNFVRLVCALVACPAPDVVKDAVRSRGLLPAVLRGLGSDPAPVALTALNALGSAIFLSGGALVPHRALLELFPPGLLGSLAGKLYARVDEPGLRAAAHAFLVPLVTGRLLLPRERASAPAGSDDASDGSSAARKRRRVEEGGSNGLLTDDLSAYDIDGDADDLEGEDEGASAARCARMGLPVSVPCVFSGARAAGTAMLEGSSPSAESASDGPSDEGAEDPEAVMVRAQLAALEAAAAKSSSSSGNNGEKGGKLGSSSSSGGASASTLALADQLGLTPSHAAALQFLAAVRSPEDPLPRDLLLRALRAFPALIPPYLRLFPFTLEPRASARWLANARLLGRVATSPAPVVPPQAGLATAVHVRVRPSVALTVNSSTASVPSGSSWAARALAFNSGGAASSPLAIAGLSSTAGYAISVSGAGDSGLGGAGEGANGSSASVSGAALGGPSASAGSSGAPVPLIGGVPVTTLIRFAVPPSLSRALLTRGLLHAHPVVVLHSLALLRAVLARAERLVREACELAVTVDTDSEEASESESGDGALHGSGGSVSEEEAARRSSAAHAEAAHIASRRAALLARALAPHLPDVQTLLAVRAKLLGALSGSLPGAYGAGETLSSTASSSGGTSATATATGGSEPSFSVSFADSDDAAAAHLARIAAHQALDSAPAGAAAAGGAAASASTAGSSVSDRVARSALLHSVHASLLGVAAAYVRLMPRLILAGGDGTEASGSSSSGSGLSISGGSGSGSFVDFTKFVPLGDEVAPAVVGATAAATTAGVAIVPRPLSHTPVTAASLPLAAQAALLRLLLSLPPPSPVDVAERWLAKPKGPAPGGAAAAAALAAAATSAGTDSAAVVSANGLPLALLPRRSDIDAVSQRCPVTALLGLLTQQPSPSSSPQAVAALAHALLHRCASAIPDPTAPLLLTSGGRVTAAADGDDDDDFASNGGNGSGSRRTQRLFRLAPLCVSLVDSSAAAPPSLADASTAAAASALRALHRGLRCDSEVDAWLHALSSSPTAVSESSSSGVAPAVLYGLAWCGLHDSLPSPYAFAAAFALRAAAAASSSSGRGKVSSGAGGASLLDEGVSPLTATATALASSPATLAAVRSAPFTLRAWLALAAALSSTLEAAAEDDARLATSLSRLESACALGTTGAGGGTGLASEAGSVASNTTRSIAAAQAAGRLHRLLVTLPSVAYLASATSGVLRGLSSADAAGLRPLLGAVLQPLAAVLGALSAHHRVSAAPSEAAAGGKKGGSKGKQAASSDDAAIPAAAAAAAAAMLPLLAGLLPQQASPASVPKGGAQPAASDATASDAAAIATIHAALSAASSDTSPDRAALSSVLHTSVPALSPAAFTASFPALALLCHAPVASGGLGGDWSPLTMRLALRPVSSAPSTGISAGSGSGSLFDVPAIATAVGLEAPSPAVAASACIVIPGGHPLHAQWAQATATAPAPEGDASSSGKQKKRKRGGDEEAAADGDAEGAGASSGKGPLRKPVASLLAALPLSLLAHHALAPSAGTEGVAPLLSASSKLRSVLLASLHRHHGVLAATTSASASDAPSLRVFLLPDATSAAFALAAQALEAGIAASSSSASAKASSASLSAALDLVRSIAAMASPAGAPISAKRASAVPHADAHTRGSVTYAAAVAASTPSGEAVPDAVARVPVFNDVDAASRLGQPSASAAIAAAALGSAGLLRACAAALKSGSAEDSEAPLSLLSAVAALASACEPDALSTEERSAVSLALAPYVSAAGVALAAVLGASSASASVAAPLALLCAAPVSLLPRVAVTSLTGLLARHLASAPASAAAAAGRNEGASPTAVLLRLLHGASGANSSSSGSLLPDLLRIVSVSAAPVSRPSGGKKKTGGDVPAVAEDSAAPASSSSGDFEALASRLLLQSSTSSTSLQLEPSLVASTVAACLSSLTTPRAALLSALVTAAPDAARAALASSSLPGAASLPALLSAASEALPPALADAAAAVDAAIAPSAEDATSPLSLRSAVLLLPVLASAGGALTSAAAGPDSAPLLMAAALAPSVTPAIRAAALSLLARALGREEVATDATATVAGFAPLASPIASKAVLKARAAAFKAATSWLAATAPAPASASLRSVVWPLSETSLGLLHELCAAAAASSAETASPTAPATSEQGAKASEAASALLSSATSALLRCIASLRFAAEPAAASGPSTPAAAPACLSQAALEAAVSLAYELLLLPQVSASAADASAAALSLPSTRAFALAVLAAPSTQPRAGAGKTAPAGGATAADSSDSSDSDSSDSSESDSSDSDSSSDDDAPATAFAPVARGPTNLLSLPGLPVLLELCLLALAQGGALAASNGKAGASSGVAPGSLLASLARHPSFLHLLLRDRWRTLGWLPARAAASVAAASASFAPSPFPREAAASLARLASLGGAHAAGQSSVASLAVSSLARDASGAPHVTDGARTSTARLLLRLTLLDPPSCVLPPLLPVFAAAYGASLSPCDRMLRRLLSLYEARGVAPALIGYAWSAAALPHVKWDSPVFGLAASQYGGRNAPNDGSSGDRASSASSSAAAVAPGGNADGAPVDASLVSAAPHAAAAFEWLYAGEGGGAGGGSGAAGAASAAAPVAAGEDRRAAQSRARTATTGGFAFSKPAHAAAGAGAASSASGRSSGLSVSVSCPHYARIFVSDLAGGQSGLLHGRVAATLSAYPVYRGNDPEGGAGTSAAAAASAAAASIAAAAAAAVAPPVNRGGRISAKAYTAPSSHKRKGGAPGGDGAASAATGASSADGALPGLPSLVPLLPARYADSAAEVAVASAYGPDAPYARAALASGTTDVAAAAAFLPAPASDAGLVAGAPGLTRTRTRSRGSAYDPSWTLSALAHCMLSGRVQARRFITCGGLSLALGALTSAHEDVRKVGYAVVGAFYELIAPSVAAAAAAAGAAEGGAAGASAGARAPPRTGGGGPRGPSSNLPPLLFREQPLVRALMALLRSSVTVPFQRIPALHACFIAEVGGLLLRPSHRLHPLVRRYVLKHSSLDFSDVPLLYTCLAATGLTVGGGGGGAAAATLASPHAYASAAREWMLRLLVRGLQGAADHAALRRRHAYHLALALLSAPDVASPAAASGGGASASTGGGPLVVKLVGTLLATASGLFMPVSKASQTLPPAGAAGIGGPSAGLSMAGAGDEEDDVAMGGAASDSDEEADGKVAAAAAVAANGAKRKRAASASSSDTSDSDSSDSDSSDSDSDSDDDDAAGGKRGGAKLSSTARASLVQAGATSASGGRYDGPAGADAPPPSKAPDAATFAGGGYTAAVITQATHTLGRGGAAYLRRSLDALGASSAAWARAVAALGGATRPLPLHPSASASASAHPLEGVSVGGLSAEGLCCLGDAVAGAYAASPLAHTHAPAAGPAPAEGSGNGSPSAPGASEAAAFALAFASVLEGGAALATALRASATDGGARASAALSTRLLVPMATVARAFLPQATAAGGLAPSHPALARLRRAVAVASRRASPASGSA